MPVALVTGGTRGIGRHTAELLVGRGHPVALCGRDERALVVADELAARWRIPTLGVAVDLVQPAEVERLVASVEQALGPVGILINNAAELGPVGPLHAVDPLAWIHTIQLDLGAVAVLTSRCLPPMLRAGWGRVVNLAGGGVGGPGMAEGVSAYTTAKIAVVGLTEVVGTEIDGTGVGVCAIAPGTIGTGFMQDALAADGFAGADRLRAMAEAQRDRPDDLAAFSALVHHVIDTDPSVWNGRMLSARWETPDALRALGESGGPGPARFRLRRIDETLYGELPERR